MPGSDVSPLPPYDHLADIYDLIYAHVTADIPFYQALVREWGGPVLELGCGSGRTLLPLAAAGFNVVGLDNSPAMLDRARVRVKQDNLGERVELVQGDILEFELGRQFPLITVPFNTWLHLNHQQQPAAIQCVAQHLAPGGRLVIDVPAPATIVEAEHDRSLVLEQLFTIPETGETLLQFSSTVLDQVQRILHVTWVYDRGGKDGIIHRTVAPMDLHYLFPHGVQRLAESAGLELEALWGDYGRSPYSAASEQMIVVTRRTI